MDSQKSVHQEKLQLYLEKYKEQALWGNNIFLFFSHKLPNPLIPTGLEMKQSMQLPVTVLQHQYVHWFLCTNMYATMINLIFNLLNRLPLPVITYIFVITIGIFDSNKENFTCPTSFKVQRIS